MTSTAAFPRPHYKAAFWTAWSIYMAAALSDYEAVFDVIGQPITSAVFGGIVVGLIALLGLTLRVPAIGQVWYRG